MKRLFYIFCILTAAGLVSCEQDTNPNSGIIPPSDSLLLRYTDTTTIRAFIEKDDTLRTDATERVILGSYYDPVFGKTTSSFYTTFTIGQTFNGPANAIIDSVVMQLRADGSYGDISKFNSYQVLQVFEVTQDIPAPAANSSGYNSYTSFNYHMIPIGTMGFAPQFSVFGAESAQLRIRLNNTFAQRFFTQEVTPSNVRTLIKGIYVRIDPQVTQSQGPGQGGLAYFKLNSDVSRINIYYHQPNLAQPPSFKLQMGSTNNYRINVFSHDYTTTSDPALTAKLADTNNTAISDKLYIHSLQGLRVKVNFPHLDRYVDSGKVIINKAELVIPVDETQNVTLYKLPDNVITYTLSNARKIILMPDAAFSYYDSYYDATNHEYKVVITQYLQEVMNKEGVKSSFYIDVPIFSKYSNGFRIVINSPEHALKPMKLNLTYTRIPTS